ncbi:response regulator [Pseudoalteromonas sp. CO348]|uniref:Response regulator n=1 Tax=Pseudoalteromonas maricaloris TaxID=184924 RepID=A0A8I2H5N5_9GAMM|nr:MULTISPECIES: response regulator [Pseudoalteromonas]KJZ03660.1 chemotaxis protein CheY [Pseudoalteromonas piscicida]MCG7538837.1 response regulator [Pseudoalteromonas sp. OF7H-1]MCG9767267.1 response regulator [Pseudoalteromonas piscicida]NLR23493.1 response regulator [Pseudoalteromonas maricaloris]ODB36882.1 two-component system response regulator [Pseudoalteromonas sp. BMB]
MALRRILAVDDEPFNLEIIEEILEDLDFELKTVESGHECLAVVEDFDPQVILLDVSMPKMSGYEVCKAIKANPNTQHIIVMFVSARGSVEERMEGYSVGAEDYIVKPFGQGELKAKLTHLNQMLLEKDILAQQIEDATSTAFSAMANSSEMGQIVTYIEQIGEIETIPRLAEALCQCLKGLGLNCNVEVRLEGQKHHFATTGICSPIVIELFEILHTKGRLHEFTNRILVNYPFLSILILNMPGDDPDKHGRLRDHICFIASVTEQQLIAISTKRKLVQQHEDLEEAIKMVQGKFNSMVSLLDKNRQENEKVFRSLQELFEERIPTMGLDEDQEMFIYQNVDKAIQSSVAREESVREVKTAFHDIEEDLKLLSRRSE